MAERSVLKRAVLITCDNPRHARGKVQKLASLVLSEDGTVGWAVNHASRDRRSARLKAAGRDIRQDTLDWLKSAPACKLCGSRLPWPLTLDDTDAILETGVSRLSITELQAIVQDRRFRLRRP